MEKSEYEEFLEFKEFQKIRQQQNSRAVGEVACKSQKKPINHPKRYDREDTMDYGADITYNFDNQGNYEGESW